MFKAKSMYDESNPNPAKQHAFVASRGWLEKFMSRNGLSCRRKTTSQQKDPSLLIDKLVAYIMHVRRLQMQWAYTLSYVIAMDETPVWADMVSVTTIENTGTKDVPLKTSGHEKVRVTVCLTARGGGRKLKPFIVFAAAKRESKALHEEFKSQCSISSSGNGWMNKELTLRWVKEILGRFSFNKRLLARDT